MRLSFGRILLFGLPLLIGLATGYFSTNLVRWIGVGEGSTQTEFWAQAEGEKWIVYGHVRDRLETHVTVSTYESEAAAQASIDRNLAMKYDDAESRRAPASSSLPWWCRPGLSPTDGAPLIRDLYPDEDIPEQFYYLYHAGYSGTATGWPMRSRCYHNVHGHTVPDGQLFSSRGFIVIDGNVCAAAPAFPGVVVNMLIYSVPWYGLFFGLNSLRRRYRQRKCGCTECGYDITGLDTCPECGRLSPPPSPTGEVSRSRSDRDGRGKDKPVNR